MLDRYLLEHELGAGARGVVYRARHRDTGRLVAIKLTPAAPRDGEEIPEGAPKKTARTSVRNQLVHPSIPAVYEAGLAGHLSYEVLALFEGTDLRAYTDPGTLLPLATVLSIGSQIADALHHAHQCGVIHGDIKPANIIFDPATGRTAVTDFPAVSRVVCERGTPAYRAPECLRGDSASAASDQFSLAVTLYQLACGEHPFAGRTRPEIASRMVTKPHTDIRLYAPSVPIALVKLFDKAMAKQPGGRYRHAKALKGALRRIQADVNTRAIACSGTRDVCVAVSQ